MNHPSPLTDLAGLIAGAWGLIAIVTFFSLVFFWPLMALSVTLNIRKIRKELQQLNETLSLPSRRL